MYALVLADEPDAAGHFGDWASSTGLQLETCVRTAAGVVPDLGGFDFVASMGSKWSVNDRYEIPWIEQELRLLEAAVRSQVPILGVCFGGQMLAQALGGSVEKANEPEIGWVSLASQDEATVPSGLWFEWHYDNINPPPSVEIICRNQSGVQGFRYGCGLGLQFHPEVTVEIVEEWCRESSEQLQESGIDRNALISRTAERQRSARVRAHQLFDAFLARSVRARDPYPLAEGPSRRGDGAVRKSQDPNVDKST
jgi:GMP synthase-like glutamine amidotransferase